MIKIMGEIDPNENTSGTKQGSQFVTRHDDTTRNSYNIGEFVFYLNGFGVFSC